MTKRLRSSKKRRSTASPPAGAPDSGEAADVAAPEVVASREEKGVGISEQVSENPRKQHSSPHLGREKKRQKKKCSSSLSEGFDSKVDPAMGIKSDGDTDMKKKKQLVPLSDNLETEGDKNPDTLLQTVQISSSEVKREHDAPLDEAPPREGDFDWELHKDCIKASLVEKKYRRKKRPDNQRLVGITFSDLKAKAAATGSAEMGSKNKFLLGREKKRQKKKCSSSLSEGFDSKGDPAVGIKSDGETDMKKRKQLVPLSNNLETEGDKNPDTLLQTVKISNSEVKREHDAPFDEAPPREGDFDSELLEVYKKASMTEKKYKRKKRRNKQRLGDGTLFDPKEDAPATGSAEMGSKNKFLNHDDSNRKLLTIAELNYIPENLDADPGNKHEAEGYGKSSSPEMKDAGPSIIKSYKRKRRKRSNHMYLNKDIANAASDVIKDDSSINSSLFLLANMAMKSETKHDSEMSLHNSMDLPVKSVEFSLTEGGHFDSSKNANNSGIHSKSPDIEKAYSRSNDMVTTKVKTKSCFSKSNQGDVSSPSCCIPRNCASLNGASPLQIVDHSVNDQNNNEKHMGEELMLSAREETFLTTADAVSVRKGDIPCVSNSFMNEGKTTNSKRRRNHRGKRKKSFETLKDVGSSSSIETSGTMLVGKGNVDQSSKCTLILNVHVEGSGVTKSTDDKTQNVVACEEATQVDKVNEEVSCQSLSCSDLTVEQISGNLPKTPCQVVESCASDSSDKVSVSQEPPLSREPKRKLRKKKEKRTAHDKGCCDTASEQKNGCLADEIPKELEACGAVERNLNAVRSLPPSPIRGVINDSAVPDLPNSLKASLDSSGKEDVGFSFQIIDSTLMGKPPRDYSEKAFQSRPEVGSENAKANIHKDSALTDTFACNGIEPIVYQKNHNVAPCEIDLFVDLDSSLDEIEDKSKIIETVLSPERTLSHSTRKKLLVLDLNGLLADIFFDGRNAYKAHRKVGGKSVCKRPFCDDFLEFCFQRFEIGIWSSRKRYNVDDVVDYLMGDIRHKLLFCWDLSKCTETGFKTIENMHKPLVLKEMKKLWNKEEPDLPWKKGDYSPSNTLLIDDSPYKALCNPPHTAIFPRPFHYDDVNDSSLGPEGDIRLYLEGLAMTDNVQHYVQAHPFGQPAIKDTDPSWKFYLRVMVKIEKSSLPTG